MLPSGRLLPDGAVTSSSLPCAKGRRPGTGRPWIHSLRLTMSYYVCLTCLAPHLSSPRQIPNLISFTLGGPWGRLPFASTPFTAPKRALGLRKAQPQTGL